MKLLKKVDVHAQRMKVVGLSRGLCVGLSLINERRDRLKTSVLLNGIDILRDRSRYANCQVRWDI